MKGVQDAIRAYQFGRIDEAEQICADILRSSPGNVDALHMMGCFCMARSRLSASRDYLEKALRLRPAANEILYNYACCLMQAGDLAGAAQQFRSSLSLGVKQKSEAWNNVGFCLNKLDRLEEAEAAYRKALEVDPRKVATWCNLGNLLKDLSRFDEALAVYDRAAKANPKFPTVWRGQMLTLIYPDYLTGQDRFDQMVHLGRKIAAGIAPLPKVERARNDRLRVGWHTSDLYANHPVARNLAPFFDGAKEGMDYYLYLDVPTPDATTNWFASKSKTALRVSGMTDKALAEQIQSDKIDVMIYLAGRLDNNRPQVAAYRPAPVNVSMFDVATSGIPGMDYFVADGFMVASEEQFTEKLIALSNVYVHEPLPHAPPVSPAPRLVNGYPTFGCFNNPAKIGPQTLALWERILLDLPDARLVLHYKAMYGLPGVAQRILAGMPKIATARIEFGSGDAPNSSHLARYAGIDIALDPFPVNGSTTTFEALHQGVPVIALRGNSVVSRWSSALVGRVAPEFVAGSKGDYVALARKWACEDVDRESIRARLIASPICQVGSTVADFEDAIRKLLLH